MDFVVLGFGSIFICHRPKDVDMRRILLTRTDRMGDVVLTTPVIRQLRKVCPDAYIAMMVKSEYWGLLANNPDLDEVIVYDKRGREKSLLDTIKFAFMLRKKKFDTAIAFHPTNRVHLMLFLAGISTRVGYNRKMGFLLSKRMEHEKHLGEKHESDYSMDLLEYAGFSIDNADKKPYIVTSEGDKKAIDSTMKNFGIGNNVVAMHVGASCVSKRWSAESFAQVTEVLSDKYSAETILVGGEESEEFSKEVMAIARCKVIDITGILSLSALAEFLSRCRIFISNDSGPVHVATAVGTPVVVIFGRNDPGLSPKRWRPVGEDDQVIHKPGECDPCLAHNCKNEFACLKAISPEDVVKAVEMVLE